MRARLRGDLDDSQPGSLMKTFLPTLLLAIFALTHFPSSAQDKKAETNAEPAKAAVTAKDDAAKKDEAKAAQPKVSAKKADAAKDDKKKPKRGGC
jgi:hypothetical protein